MDLGIDQPTRLSVCSATRRRNDLTCLRSSIAAGGARVGFVEHNRCARAGIPLRCGKHRARGRVGCTDIARPGRDEDDSVAAVFEDQAEMFLARLQVTFAPLERFEQSVETAVELTNLVEVGDRKRDAEARSRQPCR